MEEECAHSGSTLQTDNATTETPFFTILQRADNVMELFRNRAVRKRIDSTTILRVTVLWQLFFFVKRLIAHKLSICAISSTLTRLLVRCEIPVLVYINFPASYTSQQLMTRKKKRIFQTGRYYHVPIHSLWENRYKSFFQLSDLEKRQDNLHT